MLGLFHWRRPVLQQTLCVSGTSGNPRRCSSFLFIPWCHLTLSVDLVPFWVVFDFFVGEGGKGDGCDKISWKTPNQVCFCGETKFVYKESASLQTLTPNLQNPFSFLCLITPNFLV